MLLLASCGDDSTRPPPLEEDAGACVDDDGDRHYRIGSCEHRDADDCDDANDAIHPDAEDSVCADLNCDGVGGPDDDADGHDDDECGGDDCDDEDAARNPAMADAAGNGIDEDCDDVDGHDADGDGVASEASGGDDCDDADAAIFPGADDQVGDGDDLDCDGHDGTDTDGDGFASIESGGDDCSDRSADVHPGAPDLVDNGIDDDCDGVDGVDADGDGSASVASRGDDCDDASPEIHPGAQGDWLWEVLTSSFRGDPPSAALDSDENVWVAYVEEDPFGVNQLIVANDAAGAWATETVARSEYCVALALDAADGVHLVYRNAGEIPQYASNASGAWVFEAIGGNQGMANCTVGVAPNGVVHTVFSTDALAVTHSFRVSDDWRFEEVAAGEVITTDVSFQIDARSTLHIAYSDSGGVHYVSNATAAYAETNEAGEGPGGLAPFALEDGDTLIVAIDGGADQTVTFAAGDFANIAAATAAEVRAAIAAQLAGAVVSADGGLVRIESATVGSTSTLDVDIGSTAISGDKLDMRSGAGGSHAGGVWIEEGVDAGQTARLALLGYTPAIIYQGVPRMTYAVREGEDTWTTQSTPWDSLSPDLTFDSNGYPHAVFGDVATENVLWADSDTGGAQWSSRPVQPSEGNETIGRILMDSDDRPIVFVVQELDGVTSLQVARQGVPDGVDQDCDGRIW